MSKLLFTLIISAIFCFCSIDSRAISFSKDSVFQKKSTTFYPYWSLSAGVGLSVNSEFIANAENTPTMMSGFRLLHQHQVFSCGIGYDAQVLSLKSTASSNTGQVYKYGDPLHSVFGLLEIRKTKTWGNIYLGVLLGYASGKIEGNNDLTKYSIYTSTAGYLLGGIFGIEKNLRKKFSIYLELVPKLYLLEFKHTKSGVEKTANRNVLVLPVLVGLKYSFK